MVILCTQHADGSHFYSILMSFDAAATNGRNTKKKAHRSRVYAYCGGCFPFFARPVIGNGTLHIFRDCFVPNASMDDGKLIPIIVYKRTTIVACVVLFL